MILNIRAERLKMKHTFGSILPQTAALLTLVLTLGLAYGNEYYSANAWNWWYVMLLPGMLCVLCCLGIKREKKMQKFLFLITDVEFFQKSCLSYLTVSINQTMIGTETGLGLDYLLLDKLPTGIILK